MIDIATLDMLTVALVVLGGLLVTLLALLPAVALARVLRLFAPARQGGEVVALPDRRPPAAVRAAKAPTRTVG